MFIKIIIFQILFISSKSAVDVSKDVSVVTKIQQDRPFYAPKSTFCTPARKINVKKD